MQRNGYQLQAGGEYRTPESLLIARERSAFRQAVLDQAIAAIASDYLRLIIHAHYQLGWSIQAIADEFRIEQSTAWRAHNRALELLRQQLAVNGVSNLRDIL